LICTISPLARLPKIEGLTLSPLFPLLQLSKAKSGRTAFPAAISPALFLSGDRQGVVEGGGPTNHRVGSSLPRSRVCLSSVDGEARVCREVVPLRCAFLGVINEAKVSMTPGNKLSPPLLRPCDAPL
jgi:hypothetical protein